MANHRITSGCFIYSNAPPKLEVELENGVKTVVKHFRHETGNSFEGIVQHPDLTCNAECLASGTFDPYSQTGTLMIEGPAYPA